MGVKILLIAYDFPPVLSPQSLRWAYLVRELVAAGNEVRVLAPDLKGEGDDLLPLVAGATVHRTFPGFIATALRSRGNEQPSASGTAAESQGPRAMGRTHLNWKGVLAARLKAVAGLFFFPDARGEWNFWARRALRERAPAWSPDVVISSHEPANTIPLGAMAASLGKSAAWVVDMADPILATYTPRRWTRRAGELESAVARRADAVLVTSERMKAMLSRYPGCDGGRIHLVTQGFDDRFVPEESSESLFDPARLELLYTGSFYSFRRADWLLEAIGSVPGVRLTVVSSGVPADVRAWATNNPGKLRVLGGMAHRSVLTLQRDCDVLVNIANDDPLQVPGKFYEYLGAGKPIIQVALNELDAASNYLADAGRRDWIAVDSDRLVSILESMKIDKHGGIAGERGVPGVEEFSWRHIGGRLDGLLGGLVRDRRKVPLV